MTLKMSHAGARFSWIRRCADEDCPITTLRPKRRVARLEARPLSYSASLIFDDDADATASVMFEATTPLILSRRR